MKQVLKQHGTMFAVAVRPVYLYQNMTKASRRIASVLIDLANFAQPQFVSYKPCFRFIDGRLRDDSVKERFFNAVGFPVFII
jgi:hypothetical protein